MTLSIKYYTRVSSNEIRTDLSIRPYFSLRLLSSLRTRGHSLVPRDQDHICAKAHRRDT